jgi:hypothetical protein
MRSSSSATVKRRFSCATKAAHNVRSLPLSAFWNATIRGRASRVPIARGGPAQVLVLPEVPWEETDWHNIAEERFAGELADALYRHAQADLFEKLVIIAPPKILGNLRKVLHVEVTARVAAEIPKELTSHPVAEIERLIAA